MARQAWGSSSEAYGPHGRAKAKRWFVSERAMKRTRWKCTVLAVLVVPVVLWKLVVYRSGSGSHNADEYEPLSGEISIDAEARRLAAFADSLPPIEKGYDCLSVDEYQDRKSVKLRMVRKYHVTMGGEEEECYDGSTDLENCARRSRDCASGMGPCLQTPWTLLLYVPSMFYMFIALALVCDEFFVPSLEMFVEHYDIDADVAGATLMAAGGSMPELFTSLLSVFDESEVGFAAIVGSAVFNVLFVISVCTLASTEPLQLTGWPLGRDCIFYIIALLLVWFVLIGPSPKKVEIWEAFLLFCFYLGYCTFMFFNTQIRKKAESWWNRKRVVPIDGPEPGEDKIAASHTTQMTQASGQTHFRMPSTFRSGIVNLLTQRASLVDTAGIQVVTELKGNLKDAFDEVDEDNDGMLSESEFSKFMGKLRYKGKEENILKAWHAMPLTKEGLLTFDTFKKWYLVSSARVEIEVRRVFDHLDKNGDGFVDENEIGALLTNLGHKCTPAQLEVVVTSIVKCAPQTQPADELELVEENLDKEAGPVEGKPSTGTEVPPKSRISFDTFETWYNTSIYADELKKVHKIHEQEEEELGFNIVWPEDPTTLQLAWYIFTYPLCAAMYCSLPDVRRPGMEGKINWAIVEFVLSLFWIAVFTNMLYECCVVVSNTVGFPPEIAAVTIIAGGTSIPDLLSSYIVARQGQGDMAVSSSIGSNIFDVTVGLPIPWMLFGFYQIFRGKENNYVEVSGDALSFSLLVLILMLVAVLATIVACGWRLTKQLGGVMMILYFLFVVQYLLQQFPAGQEKKYFTPPSG